MIFISLYVFLLSYKKLTLFKKVRFDKLEGKNFLNKMEFLMAILSSTS